MIEKLKNFFKCPPSHKYPPHIHTVKLLDDSDYLNHDDDLDKGGILYFLGSTQEKALDNPRASPFYKGTSHLGIPSERYQITLENVQCSQCKEIKKVYFLRLLPK